MSISAQAALVRNALRLEWLTIGWLAVEATVALAAASPARSLSLTAYGADSLIELISAGVLIWRLLVELKQGPAFPQWVEQAASRIGGILLFLLAAYVTSAPACGWLSVAVVIGLTAQFLLAAWRVDPVISFPIVWFLLKEAREAWIGREHQNGAKAKIE